MKRIVSTEKGGKMLLESEVKVESLSELERKVWNMQYGVYRAIGGYPENISYPKIVESIMYEDNNKVTLGCYPKILESLITKKDKSATPLSSERNLFTTALNDSAKALVECDSK